MGLLERLRLRRPSEAHAKQVGILARLIPMWKAGKVLPGTENYRRVADEGYRRNVLIHSCIKEIARTTADPDLQVCRPGKEGDEEPLDEHALLTLLEKPNPEQSQFEWLEELVTHLAGVAGNAYTHKVRARSGEIVQLWQLRPDRVKIIPGADGIVERYELRLEDGGSPKTIPAKDVIHFKLPDPLDDYYGLSPILVLARYGDLDDAAIDYLRAFFENAGTPQGVLKFKTQVNAEERKRLKELWQEEHGGLKGWHRVSVLDADAEYEELGTRPDKLRLEAVFDETETRICAVYGIPPIVVGTRIGLMRSTFANYESAVRQFWQETLGPLYTRLGDKLTQSLAREFGSDLSVRFDLGSVEALQESQHTRRKWALEGWKEGLLTRNEARGIVGLDEADIGEVYREANTYKIISAEASVEDREPEMVAPQDGEEDDDEEPMALPEPTILHKRRKRKPIDAEWKAIHEAADRHYLAMAQAFVRNRGLTADEVSLDALTTALSTGGLAEAERLIAWDTRAAPRLREAWEPVLRRTLVAGAEATERFLPVKADISLAFDESNELAAKWASERSANLVIEVSRTTRAAIRRVIRRSFDEGIPPRETSRLLIETIGLTESQAGAVANQRAALLLKGITGERLEELVAKYAARALRRRAQTIALTETIAAANEGQMALWREAAGAGLIDPSRTMRSWIVTPDDRLDTNVCLPMTGQRVAFDAPFRTGDGRSVMNPPAHPRCRCAIALEVA